MSSKKWLLAAVSGVALAGVVQTTQATLRIDTKVVAINGVTNPAALPAGAWNPATNTIDLVALGPGQHTFSVDVMATVLGLNGSRLNEGFQSIIGSFRSRSADGSNTRAAAGKFVATGTELLIRDENDEIIGTNGTLFGFGGKGGFAGDGSQNGEPALTPKDVVPSDILPLDGNADFGSNPTDELGTGAHVAIRATALKGDGFGTEILGPTAGRIQKIGSFDWMMTGNPELGTTILEFEPRRGSNGNIAQSAGLWQEDDNPNQAGTKLSRDGGDGVIILDQPGQNVTIIAVPEPASMAMLAIGGLGLLARRRK